MRFTAMLALLLAACGGKGEGSGPDETPGTATADQGGGTQTLQAGAWQIRIEVVRLTASGPLGSLTPTIPPRIVRACLTPEKIGRSDARFFTGQEGDPGCTSENLTTSNGNVRGGIACSARRGVVRSTFEGRFSSTSYAITQRSVTGSGTDAVEMESRVTGRRTGDCPTG